MSLLRSIGVSKIPVHRGPVKWDHDDLASVPVIAFFFFLGHIDYRQSHRRDMALLDQNAGPLELVPMIYGAVCIPDKICAWFIGKPLIFQSVIPSREIR